MLVDFSQRFDESDRRESALLRRRDELGRLFFYPDAPVAFTVKHDAFAPPIGKITAPVANDVLTGTVTVEGYAYSYDFTHRAAVTGLPILPSLGLRASF